MQNTRIGARAHWRGSSCMRRIPAEAVPVAPTAPPAVAHVERRARPGNVLVL